jgi:hypothetical protein
MMSRVTTGFGFGAIRQAAEGLTYVDHFSVDGFWWLPETPRLRVPGTVTFDEDGARLVLHGDLRQIELPAPRTVGVGRWQSAAESVVHGRSHDGEHLTVLGATGFSDGAPYDFVKHTMDLDLVLRGSHAADDQFDQVWFSFDYLDAWTDPPDVRIEEEDGSYPSQEVRAHFGQLSLAKPGCRRRKFGSSCRSSARQAVAPSPSIGGSRSSPNPMSR